MQTSPKQSRPSARIFPRIRRSILWPAYYLRAALLRPIRREMAEGFARAATDQQALRDGLAAMQVRFLGLESTVAALQGGLGDQQEQMQHLQHEAQRQLGELQRQLDQAYGELHELQQHTIVLHNRAGTLELNLTATNTVVDADRLIAQTDRVRMAEQMAAAQQDRAGREAALAQDIGTLREQVFTRVDRQRDQLFRLEKLTTYAAPSDADTSAAGPAVSIILPTYNRATFLGEAIASVQAQSFRNWELMIVDDGSTDGTESAVWFYLSDPRIRYIRQAQAGAAAARNNGLRQTTAPLIAYIDSDNLWCPDFLAGTVAALAAQPEVDLVYGALISDDHLLDHSCILWSDFDRDALLCGNFIDTNTILHRRSLVARFGGWDASLRRLLDWDLLLRYTSEKPGVPVPVLAARYRSVDTQRITVAVPHEPDEVAIRAKWFPPALPARRPRVLYLAWHYPQLSESYIETEILCMLAWGVHVELWRTARGPSGYPTVVPIHDGSLAEAIAAAKPDVIHVHWVSYGNEHAEALAASGLPVTLRLHGFDTTTEGLRAWLAHDWAKGVYGYPMQIAHAGLTDPRLIAMPVAFDTRLFRPARVKNRRMVIRTAASLPSKDLDLFLEAARRLPDYRFVLAAVTCHLKEDFAYELRAACDNLQAPVELRFDVPRADVAALVAESAFYLHTMHPPGTEDATPVGQPISISEAMATGAYCLVRDVPDLADMVDDAGTTYRNVEDVVAAIRATEAWSDADWQAAQRRAVSRAWGAHADTKLLRPLFDEWMVLSAQQEDRGLVIEGGLLDHEA